MAYARVAFLAIFMVMLSAVAMGTDHVVGDDKGWILDFNYTQWANDKVFRVGDKLVFNYDKTKHNVVKVNGTLFQNCSFTPANEELATGNDYIELKDVGKKWYICGKSNHCAEHQMKFVINVQSEAPAPAPSSSAHSILSSLSGVFMAATVAIAAIFA